MYVIYVILVCAVFLLNLVARKNTHQFFLNSTKFLAVEFFNVLVNASFVLCTTFRVSVNASEYTTRKRDISDSKTGPLPPRIHEMIH